MYLNYEVQVSAKLGGIVILENVKGCGKDDGAKWNSLQRTDPDPDPDPRGTCN